MINKQIKIFVVVSRYLVNKDIIDNNRPDHVLFLNKYYDQGKIIISGRQTPTTGGVIMIHAESREEVVKIMSEDPFVSRKLVELSIFEFEPMRFDSLKKFVEIV